MNQATADRIAKLVFRTYSARIGVPVKSIRDHRVMADEQIYKATLSIAARYLMSNLGFGTFEQELVWVNGLLDLSDGFQRDQSQLLDAETRPGSGMDSAYEEYKRKQRFVERECHLPGHRFLRLREQGDYEHLACSAIWMMAPERWRQGRLLEQTYHVARFKRALGRNPSKSPCRQYLDALCDFVSAEDGQPDDRAFGSLIRAASDVWGYGSRSKASMHLPDVRAHVTHWLFLMDPYNNIYLKTNKQWESIRAESDGSLDEPFTAAVYDSILRDARAALALFRKHGAKDLLDLQTMLFLLNQEDERFPPGQA